MPWCSAESHKTVFILLSVLEHQYRSLAECDLHSFILSKAGKSKFFAQIENEFEVIPHVSS
jgi:hypothetical protein